MPRALSIPSILSISPFSLSFSFSSIYYLLFSLLSSSCTRSFVLVGAICSSFLSLTLLTDACSIAENPRFCRCVVATAATMRAETLHRLRLKHCDRWLQRPTVVHRRSSGQRSSADFIWMAFRLGIIRLRWPFQPLGSVSLATVYVRHYIAAVYGFVSCCSS